MRLILLSLFFVMASALGQEVALQGMCTSNASTNLKGVNGFGSAKEITKPLYYVTIVNQNELTLVGLDEVKKVYRGLGNQGKLVPQNAWSFSDGFTDVTLYAIKNDMPVIMNVESKTSPPYYWGPCSISESSLSSYVGTIYAEPIVQNNQGKLTSCGIQFASYIKDFAYHQGQRYYITGSFGIRKTNENGAVIFLKLITDKVDSLGKLSNKPEKPNFAYLKSSKNLTTAKSVIQQFDGESGSLLTAYKLDKQSSDLMLDMSFTNKISVVFNRTRNGQDIEVPIDLNVESIDGLGKVINNLNTMNTYKNCMDEFVKSFK